MNYFEEIIEAILSGRVSTGDELHREKVRLCKVHKMDHIPGNPEILGYANESQMELLEPFLKIKPVRTISGVAVVAVMTSPHDCPHGKCLYCPGGVKDGTAQSYTGREPAAMRASNSNFDPFLQVQSRIGQLQAIGHKTDKIDLIIMGGTFTAREPEYQREFTKGCFDAMNGCNSSTLEEAQEKNEKADSRCIGLTVETRPDMFFEPQIDLSLELGATRVELGVQTLNDSTLDKMERGHGTAETRKATRLARDAGMKVGYHLMPNLPGETLASDIKTFKRLFSDESYKPDMLKIYPTLVIKGTGLYEMWKRGEYEPYTLEEQVRLIADIKSNLPKWVRIQRIQRDIPVQLIEAGAKKSHLRELAQEELGKRGKRCRCIRCREAGHNLLKGRKPENVERLIEEYSASGGKEFFVSFEDIEKEILMAFARLRIPSDKTHRPEMSNAAVIRELRVLGQTVPIGKKIEESWQHKGYGEMLIERCKEITRDQGKQKLLVMSGVGVREYYRKLGFERDGPYMAIQIS